MNYLIIKNWENIKQYCPLHKVRKRISQRTLDVTQIKLIMCRSQKGQRFVQTSLKAYFKNQVFADGLKI